MTVRRSGWVWVAAAALVGCNSGRAVESSDSGTTIKLDTTVIRDHRGVADHRPRSDWRWVRDVRGVAPDVAVPAKGKRCVLWCDTKADCPAPHQHCVNHQCGCMTDADCKPLFKGGCDPSLGVCMMCASSPDCWYTGVKLMTGKCSSAGVCIGCDTSVDCDFPGSVFKHCKNGQCVICTSDIHCAFGLSRCNTSTGSCFCANDGECCKVAGKPVGCGLLCKAGRCECLADATCAGVYGINFRCR